MAAMTQIAELPPHARRDKDLAKAICDHIGAFLSEIREADAQGFPRSHQSEQALTFGIAIMTLGLLSQRSELQVLLLDHFGYAEGNIVVEIHPDSFLVTIHNRAWSFETNYLFDHPDSRTLIN